MDATWSVALSATLHCLTGCAIGEITGMVVGTALGFSEWGTVALAVVLAFLFGYALTSLPLLRAGLALGAVIPIALASDTISIAVMEVVDNAIMLAVPGAMEAGLTNTLFWGSLSVALVVAGAVAMPVNRWLHRPRQGPCGRPRDRHPRRSIAASDRDHRDRGRDLRHDRAAGRGARRLIAGAARPRIGSAGYPSLRRPA